MARNRGQQNPADASVYLNSINPKFRVLAHDNREYMLSNTLMGAAVMIERRQTLRSRVIYGGVIAFNERRSTIECIVRNFTEDGAKIEFENPALLPDEVDLLIAKKSRAFRAKMVWRQATTAGLAFDVGARNAPIPLDWARRLRLCESERRELQSRIAQLLSER
jgi:hypothetical protein